MPKLSLWKDYKSRDFYFADKVIKENLDHSGVGIYLHKYIGPSKGKSETSIDDVLFLENRNRKYDDSVYEMRAYYAPVDNDINLTQFGIFLSQDTFEMLIHYEGMIEILGRKIMAGDVIELLNVKDSDTLDENKPALNQFFVVDEATRSAKGFGPSWRTHLWRIKVKKMTYSEEYSDILGSPGVLVDDETDDVVGQTECGDYCSQVVDLISITDQVVAEAESHVMFDPAWFDTAHLYMVECEDGSFELMYHAGTKSEEFEWAGTGVPPNGGRLAGSGTQFPATIAEGEYFLRTDFKPDRLYRKKGDKLEYIMSDVRRKWTPVNTALDSHIWNYKMLDDSTTEKVAINKVIKPKVNLNADKFDSIKKGKQ